MKMAPVVVVALMVMCMARTTLAQASGESKPQNPYACLDEAARLSRAPHTQAIYHQIRLLEETKPYEALSYCIRAELLKRVGDYSAEEYYNKAIAADNTEP